MANEIDEDTILCELLCRLRSTFRLNESNCYAVEEVGANADQITVGGRFIIQVAPQEVSPLQEEQCAAVSIVTMPVDIGIITGIQLDPGGKMEKALRDAERGTLALSRILRKSLIGWDVEEGKLASLVYAQGRSRGKTGYDTQHRIAWRVHTFHFDFDEATT